MNELVYVIDTFSLMFQVFHAIAEMTGPSGQPTNAVFGFTRDLQLIRTQKQATHVICAIDSSGPGSRSDTYAEYKANRSEIPVDLAAQIPFILQVIEAFGTPAISYPAWEADDVIATIARQAVERGMDVRIVTSDKDCRQLIGPHVQLFNIRKNTFFDAEALKKDWGVRPDQVVDFQALVGDSVDNVPGVPLIGPKKASALIEQFGTLETILANADKAAGGPKLKENLKNFAEQARISRVLVELNANLPIEIDWEACPRQRPRSSAPVGSVHRTRLRALRLRDARSTAHSGQAAGKEPGSRIRIGRGNPLRRGGSRDR